MPMFTVSRAIDAWVIQEAEVEAEDASEATELARHNDDDYDWQDEWTRTFDARAFVTLGEDREPIECTRIGDF